ncbi:Tyrosine--tRNA ligase [compost metagenome]
MLTFLPMVEVKRLSSMKDQEINEAKKIAAFEITKLIHGATAAKEAEEASQALFEGQGSIDNMPSTRIDDVNISILDALVLSGIVPSKGQARTLISQGGVTLNDNKIEDSLYILSEKDFSQGYAILKKGKKIFHKLEK